MNAEIYSNLQIHSSMMKNIQWDANQIWNNKFEVNLIIFNVNYPVLQQKFVQIECSHELWSTQVYFTFLWKVSLHDLWSLLPHLTHESLVFFLHYRMHLPCFVASRKWFIPSQRASSHGGAVGPPARCRILSLFTKALATSLLNSRWVTLDLIASL